MTSFGKIKKLKLRDIWQKEAHDFTPWLAKNITGLGESIGMELELNTIEANVGDFSLDLLANDLGTGSSVVIENQLTPTDHDHLGKLLTYAAGFDAKTVVWVAESIRDEHRQTLEWLNQRTGSDTQFFAVIIEVIQIDDSKPAYNFRPVVFPNEWQKSSRRKADSNISTKGDAYKSFFQNLIDDLREKHKFTGARIGQPQNWYAFSAGISGIQFCAVFSQGGKVRVEAYIDLGDYDKNKKVFDNLYAQRENIEQEIGLNLTWEKLEEKRASRISIYQDGSIESNEEELIQIHNWMIDKLLKFKKVFKPKFNVIIKKIAT